MDWSKSNLRIVPLVLIAVVALAVPLASEAKTKSYATTITASAKNKNFVDGQVSSFSRCVPNRFVTVYTGAGASVGSTRTDTTGKWQLSVKSLAPGSYYATVTRKRIKVHGKKRICRAGTSPAFTTT